MDFVHPMQQHQRTLLRLLHGHTPIFATTYLYVMIGLVAVWYEQIYGLRLQKSLMTALNRLVWVLN